jgi:polyphenol oxidase
MLDSLRIKNNLNHITPNWPAPKNVKAFTTTLTSGNLATHTGDNLENVLANRKKLSLELNLPSEPFWLKQEHTATVIHLTPNINLSEPVADAAFTTSPNLICVVLTADCVPILLCDRDGTMVAAIHAGWRGIANGVIEATIKAMNVDPTKLLAWLGPAIGTNAFETGDDVHEIFVKHDPNANKAFVKYHDGFLTNIYLLASQCLNNVGVTAIYGGEYCTFTQKELFFSFRRDGINSGRMANLIWKGSSPDNRH